jgi:hypothetical protein
MSMRRIRAASHRGAFVGVVVSVVWWLVGGVVPVRGQEPSWTALSPPVRRYGAMAYDEQRKMSIFFGGISSWDTNTFLNETWGLNEQGWTRLATTGPSPRYRPAMAYDSNRGVIVLFGGLTSNGTDVSDETWEWDGVSWKRLMVTGPLSRASQTMSFDSQRGRVVMFGGLRFESGRLSFLSDTWEWDGVHWELKATGGLNPRYSAAACFDPVRNRTVLYGGNTGSATFANGTWEWDGTAWTLRSQVGPPPSAEHAMAFNPVLGVSMMFSGALGGDLWAWDGSAWTLQPSSRTRPGGLSASACFDTALGVLVGFTSSEQTVQWNASGWTVYLGFRSSSRDGGMAFDSNEGLIYQMSGSNEDGSGSIGVWRLVGTRWQSVSASGPSSRFENSVAYDADRRVMVMFGGSATDASVWEWSGGAWREFTSPGPSPRFGSKMVYDSRRKVVVMHGGRSTNVSPATSYRDTWEWDGVSWSLRVDNGPLGSIAGMVYDAARQETLISVRDGSAPAEFWAWNGVEWSRRDGIPGRTDAASITYDSVRELVIGSGSGFPVLSQITEWNGRVWVARSISSTVRQNVSTSGLIFDPKRNILYAMDARTWKLSDLSHHVDLISQPTTANVCPGSTVEFATEAVGTGPITYQWRFAPPIAPAMVIDGAVGPRLVITNASDADVGGYDCVVRGRWGTEITQPVRLTFDCPADYDRSGGTPDGEDISAYMTDWLTGDPLADVDCSGGTPDASDVSAFFVSWLAGGC